MRFLVLVLVTLACAAPAAAASSLQDARRTAQRYLNAVARGDEAAVCHYLTPGARRELIEGAHDEDRRVHTCLQAARTIPRQFGRYPITKVERNGATVVVWIDDHEISDSGSDNLVLIRSGGRWRVDAT